MASSKRVCLLMGFHYDENPIPSVIVDLHAMYEEFSRRSWDIYIYIDFIEIPDKSDTLFFDEGIGIAMHTWFNDIKSQIKTIKNCGELEDAIESTDLTSYRNVLVYYTGHGEKDGSIRLVEDSTMKFIDYRDLILERCSISARIVFIMDCCYSGPMGLPYVYN